MLPPQPPLMLAASHSRQRMDGVRRPTHQPSTRVLSNPVQSCQPVRAGHELAVCVCVSGGGYGDVGVVLSCLRPRAPGAARPVSLQQRQKTRLGRARLNLAPVGPSRVQ